MARTPATENKSAVEKSPATLEETNAAADKAQEDSNKRAARGKPATVDELKQSGYTFPEGYFDQESPNAGHESVEQKAGDGGAESPAKE